MDRRLLKLDFKHCVTALSDIVMPRVCVVCGRSLTLREDVLCLSCKGDFPYTHFEKHPHNVMADRYNELINSQSSDSTEPYQWAFALLHYDALYRNVTRALKYRADFEEGKYFAEITVRCIRQCPWFDDIDLVVPVPLHPLRKLRRGYNQADIIAETIGKALEVRVERHLLARVRYSTSQTSLTHEQRAQNVSGAFALKSRTPKPSARHILLVDDVFTTGATLAACHKTIRTVYDETVRISVATLAFAKEF